MKVMKQLTFSQQRRLKMMSLTTAAGVAFSTISMQLVSAQGEAALFQDGQDTNTVNFEWRNLEATDLAQDISMGAPANGKFCQARFIPNGFDQTLLSKSLTGAVLFTILVYFFVGLSVGTEYLLEAVTKIVSKTSRVDVQDLDGKTMTIGIPKWSSSVINLTLMAICATLPETFLSFMSTATQVGFNTGVAAEVGPMALLGSAGFNLIVVTGISMAASDKLKSITRVNVFLVTAAFAALALVWLFVALVVITPGYITYVEGCVTLSLFPMVIMFAWVTEKCSRETVDETEELQSSRIRVSLAHIHHIVEQRGAAYALELATGNLNEAEDRSEMELTQECFKTALGTEDLAIVTLEELVQVIEGECSVGRLNHRAGTITAAKPLASICVRDFNVKEHSRKLSPKNAKNANTKTPKDKSRRKGKQSRDFSIENVNESGRAFVEPNMDTPRDFGDMEECRRNPVIGFKQRRFAVTEKINSVKLTIEKRIKDLDQTFWVETQDDTAIAGKDFEAFSQRITMKAEENEREIEIRINNNSKFASNAQFKVILCEEEVHTQLEGIDSYAVIMLVSEKDKAQLEGLDLTVAVADPKDDNGLALADDSKSEKIEDLERRRRIIAAYLKLRNPSYCDQFKFACALSPIDEESQIVEKVSACDAFFHVIAAPWKLLFATTPSRSVGDGWVAFFYAGAMICGITFALSLLLADIGCFLDIKPVVQGLVLVSIGTSIPQAVTSVRVANSVRTKDANNVFTPVVAANAASVFLGLGAPWTIGTIYRHVTVGQPLLIGKFETGHLAFAAVTLFAISIIAFIILGLRRWCVGGEIGGGKISRVFTATLMILLWCAFVGANVTNTYANWNIFTPEINSVAATQLDSEQVKLLKAQHNFNSAFECQVQLTWQPPPGHRSQIGRYRLQAQDQYKRFHFLSQLCGSSGDKMSCVIPMSTFTAPPLSLPNGAPIKVRASPFISTRWGPNYDVDTGNAVVKSAPTSMPLPRAPDVAADSVTLVWDIVQRDNPNESYDVFQSSRGSQWTKITPTSIKDRTIKVSGLEPNREYLFKICAKAVCGHVFSDVLRVTTQAKSVAPVLCGHCVRIDAVADGCAVKFQWTAPHGAHASQPFNYFLSVKNGAGQMVQAPISCLNTQETNCKASMADLIAVGLSEGNSIVATVRACQQPTGLCEKNSQPSNENIKVLVTPKAVSLPVHLNAGQTNPQYISLSWEGSIMPLSWQDKPYEVLMCTGTDCTDFQQIHNTGAMTYSMRTDPAVNSYSFTIVQRNACGVSNNSEVLTINLQSVVQSIQLSTQQTNGCTVRFIWTCGADCNTITAYKLTVRGNTGFYELPQCRKVAGDQTFCDVEFDQLATYPFYLRKDSQIVAEVQAKNSVGWSAPARANSVAMSDTICRRTMLKATAYDSDKIYLEWTAVPGAKTYALFWDAGISGGNMAEVALASSNELKHTILITGNGKRNFHFQVRVECACSKSSTSNTLLVCVAAKPVGMKEANIIENCCSVTINWLVPESTPSVIQYNLVIQGRDGQFYNSQHNCGRRGTDTSCEVHNSQLVQAPYNLARGAAVRAKIQALNPAGWGPFSPVNAGGGVVLNVRPPTPSPATTSLANDNSATITWQKVLEDPIDIAEQFYQVWTNTGANGQFEKNEQNLGINSYTADNLTPAKIYKFKVRAENCCGMSAFTKEHVVTVFRVPDKPVLPCPISKCDEMVQFKWDLPNSHNSAITDQSLMILDGEGVPRKYNACSFASATTCVISTRTLMAEPFNLIPGTLIQANIKMRNQAGWSPQSDDQACEARVKIKPCSMRSPVLVSDKDDKITLKWDTCPEELGEHRYALKWDNGVQANPPVFTKLTERDAKQATFPVPTTGNTSRRFTFSIESKNELCGNGPPATLSVVRTFCPRPMECVKLTSLRCSARFSWLAPKDDGGAPVTDYKIEVQKGDGTWHHLTQCNQCQFGGKCHCDVQMRFLSEQLGLTKGSDIVVRSSSRNQVGWSAYANQCDIVKVIGLPDRMIDPVLVKQHPSTIVAQWQQCQSQGCYYQLFWGVKGAQKQQLTITDPNQLAHTQTGLQAGIMYEFCIRSWNVCGCNELSCAEAKLAKQPNPVVPITQLTAGSRPKCQAMFQWKAAIDNGAPITAYELQIASKAVAGKDPVFNTYTACGDKVNAELATSMNSGAPAITQFTCMVDMQNVVAIAPYNLSMGDSIYYRVRAQNLVGWGAWNSPQLYQQRMVSMPGEPVAPTIDQLGKDGFRVCWKAPPGLLSLARIRHDYNFYLLHNEGQEQMPLPDFVQVKGPTSDLCHMFNGLDRKMLHKVMIYVENECGKSPSPVSPVPIGTVPAAPACRITDKACVIYITWAAPQSRAPITGYHIFFQNKAGQFIEYMGCPTGPNARNCAIKMETLTAGKDGFDLRTGDPSVIQVTAENMHGSGQPCTHVNSVSIKSRPVRMPPPAAIATGMDNIRLSWGSACSGTDCSYELRITEPGALPKTKRIQQTTLEHVITEKCTTYKFEVRAWNSCGCSEWSDATPVKIGELPNPPQLLTIPALKCGVTLTWEPSTTTCEIKKYVVEIQDGQGNYRVLPGCGVNLEKRTCNLPMYTLTQTYGLKAGQNVVSRARAENCCGWSQYSPETGNVAVQTLPTKINAPTRLGTGLGPVTVQWPNECMGNSCHYILTITEEGNNVPNVQTVNGNQYIHETRRPCTRYTYSVTAHNECGNGPPSPPLFVADGSKPSAPLCLQTRGPSCSIQITWEEVRGEVLCPISGYEVQIKDGKNAWQLLPGCGTDLSQQSCQIGMEQLMATYDLKLGTNVVTQARARNCCGWSQFSVPHSSDIRINQSPKAISKPECISVNAQGFTMKWPEAANRSILYCDNGTGSKFVPRYTTSADLSVTVPAVGGVESHSCYLEARNECGSVRSDTKMIIMPKAPAPVQSTQKIMQACTLDIEWTKPEDNGEKIVNYVIQVQTGQGYWARTKECGNVPSDRKCSIHMSKLAGAPYFLQPKSPIYTRVFAVNAVGKSPETASKANEVILAGLPPVMNTPRLGKKTTTELEICWDRTALEDKHVVEFFWGTSPRTAACKTPACGLNKDQTVAAEGTTCKTIAINSQVQQLYRFVVRAVNDCGPAPYSPELTVNLCGPNCHHSFQSSVPTAPVFRPPNKNHLPDSAADNDGHNHVHESPVTVVVPMDPVPAVEPVIDPNQNLIPSQINNDNMPPPILPENMVQECDSQTGRCWFTTKPEVVPQIGTSGNEFESVTEPETPAVPATQPDTQGWSSSITPEFKPNVVPVQKPAEPVYPVTPAFKPEPTPTPRPRPSVISPVAQGSTGGWTSDGQIAPMNPSKPTPKTPLAPPATQGWSSGTELPDNQPLTPRPTPSTAVFESDNHIHNPVVPVHVPAVAPKPTVIVRPSKPSVSPVPATGGWTSGGSSQVIPRPIRRQTNVAVLPPSTNIAINGPIGGPVVVPSPTPAHVTPNKQAAGTGAWSSGDHHDYESLLAGTEEAIEDPDCPSPPTPDAINCKMEETTAALDWYPEDQYGTALLTSESGVSYQLLQSMPGTNEFIPMYEGPTPQYTISIQDGTVIRFKIRSKRDCGSTSAWQEVTCGDRDHVDEEHKENKVMAPAALSEDLEGCGVKIAWTEPKEIETTDVHEYKVEVKGVNGWKVLEGCGDRGIVLSCSVSLIKLMKEPFNLNAGDTIVVKVSAHTKEGWTESSNVSVMKMSDSNFASKMKKPKLISNNSSTITLTWGKLFGKNEGSSKVSSYKLEWTDGVNAPFTRIVDSSQQVYTIAGIIAGRTYNIKISAMNSCGFGKFSDELEVTAAGCPTTPAAPHVSIKGKDVVVIAWEASTTDADFPLREYQVLFKSKDGSYMEHKTLCDGAKPEIMEHRTCMLAMWEVPKFSGLNTGDLIQVKVRASNRNCHGDFSQPNMEGQEVNNCPKKMEPVTAEPTAITKDSITVSWPVKAHQFEIRWQDCDETVWSRKNSARTNAQSYKHTGLVNASCQRYIVRAYNKNCRGEWSDGVTFTSGEPPAALSSPVVSVEKGEDEKTHQILIQWSEPPVEDKVTGYNVYIGTSSGEYKEDADLCDGMNPEVIEKRECRIPMSSFWEGTYRKDQGTFIGVRVQASNVKGKSDLSSWNIKGPRVEKVPFQMNRPTATKSMTEAAIILEWEEQRNPLDGGSAIVSYGLEYKQTGSNEKWTPIVGFEEDYLETSYIHTDLPANEELHYRIRARNRWGWGQFSTPDLVIDTPKAPNGIIKHSSTIITKTGDANISWDAPDSNGSEIQGYKVEVQEVNGEWIPKCSTREQLKCKVRMSELRNKFKLNLGDVMKYRVRAINLAGPGPWSKVNTDGASIRTEPGTMPTLTRGQNTAETQVHVLWNKLTANTETGGSEILGYVLQEDGREIYSGLDSEATFDAEDGRIYKLRIAAWNIYGLGEFSDELKIRAGIMLAEISSVRATSVDDDKIKIEWDLKGKNKVKAYEVKIYSKVKGAFETVSKLCDGSSAAVIEEMSCTIDAEVLSRGYGYSLGDLFVAKVRAENSRGWGAWSRRSGATVFRYDAEADLAP